MPTEPRDLTQADDILITPAQAADLYYRNQHVLGQWTIYRPTMTDYPGQWVTRFWIALPTVMRTNAVMTAPDLDRLRTMMPDGASCLPRQDADDPVIEEVWL